jgi:Tol biopolymer transport system component
MGRLADGRGRGAGRLGRPGWRVTLAAGLLAVGALVGAAVAGSGPVTLVSRGDPPSDTVGSDEASISADGRFVAFVSTAANLVPGQVDVGGGPDVFLWDRVAGTTTLVSRAAGSPVTVANDNSRSPVVSADGRFVAYRSRATDLVTGQTDPNGREFDVFLYDRVAETTTLVSRRPGSETTTGNGRSESPVISADGRFVGFLSEATDLVSGQVDANGGPDVFVFDRVVASTKLVSRAAGSTVVTGDGVSESLVISADGAFLAFVSRATNLVVGQLEGNTGTDVFLYNREAGATSLVSRAGGTTATTGNQRSDAPAISADGSLVAFTSAATDLVVGQSEGNGDTDVFLFDGGTTTLVSRKSGTVTTTASSRSESPAISADGGFVAFTSYSTDLVAAQVDANNDFDVFLFDRGAGTTSLVSRTPGSGATAGNGPSDHPVISADGTVVAFVSEATNLVAGQVDANAERDVFRHSRIGGTTTLVSRTADSATTTGNGRSVAPVLSADGAAVTFLSVAANLAAGVADLFGGEDAFLHDAGSGTTAVVSRREPTRAGVTGAAGSGIGREAVSGDGRYIAFTSLAGNLVEGQAEGNTSSDVFLHDRVTGITTLVSRAAGSPTATGNAASSDPVLSADGRFVAFLSAATDLVEDQVDANLGTDVFLFDRVAGTTTLVSRLPGSALTTGSGRSDVPTISADGGFVAFESEATDLVQGQQDANLGLDVFLFDRVAGTTTLVSRTAASAVTAGDGQSLQAHLSADGRFVGFMSSAPDLLAAGDANNAFDVFLYDRVAGTTTLVSRAAALPTASANGGSDSPVVSGDGAFVAFTSLATDLVAGQIDSNADRDVFLFDRVAGTNTLVSRTAASAVTTGNAASLNHTISADGAFVAFSGLATDLVTSQADANGVEDVFLYDRDAGATTLISRAAASSVSTGDRFSDFPVLSADGAVVLFFSFSTNLVPGPVDSGDVIGNVYLYERISGATTLISQAVSRPVRSGRTASPGPIPANDSSSAPALSADGSAIALGSLASNLTADEDLNGEADVFLWVRPCADRSEPRPCPGSGSRTGR